MVDIAEVPSVLSLIDSRDAARYRGEIEPIDAKAGHIPGAKNYFYKLNFNDDGTFKNPEILQKSFDFLKENPNSTFYCGSGVSACVNILASHVAGFRDVKLYAGSWSEWIRNN